MAGDREGRRSQQRRFVATSENYRCVIRQLTDADAPRPVHAHHVANSLPHEPVDERENFTARAARWSAAHRKAAVFGWLAFMIAAFAIGSAAGMVQLKAVEAENGQSRLADQTMAKQFPRDRAGEEVLIENPRGSLAGTGYRAAVTDLVARLSRTPSVAAIRSPLAPSNQGQISRNGRAALVTFQITGDPDTATDRVAPALAATAAVQRAYPTLFIGELGYASTNRAANTLVSDDFHKAEATSLPVMLFILALAFGALVAAGVRPCARSSRVLRT